MNTKAKKQAIDSVLVHLLDSRQAIKLTNIKGED